MQRQFFHDATGDPVTTLRGLVRIRCRANGDLLARFYLLQVTTQQPSALLLREYLAFEIDAVTQLHEFVRVTRVTVLASEFASPIRIDGPGERHSFSCIALVQQGLYGKSEVLDVVTFFNGLAELCQPSNADQAPARFLGLFEEKCTFVSHVFAFCSL